MTTRPVVVLLFQPHPPYLYAALQEGRVNPFEAVAANRTCSVRLAILQRKLSRLRMRSCELCFCVPAAG